MLNIVIIWHLVSFCYVFCKNTTIQSYVLTKKRGFILFRYLTSFCLLQLIFTLERFELTVRSDKNLTCYPKINLSRVLIHIYKIYNSKEILFECIDYSIPRISIQVKHKAPFANVIYADKNYICDVKGMYIKSNTDENLLKIHIKDAKLNLASIFIKLAQLNFFNEIESIWINGKNYTMRLNNSVKIITNNLDEVARRLEKVKLMKNIRLIDLRNRNKIICYRC